MATLCSTMRGMLSLGGSADLGSASKNRTQSSAPSLVIRALNSGLVNVPLSAVHAKFASVSQLPFNASEARLASGRSASLCAMPLASNRSVNRLKDAASTVRLRPDFSFNQFGAVDVIAQGTN